MHLPPRPPPRTAPPQQPANTPRPRSATHTTITVLTTFPSPHPCTGSSAGDASRDAILPSRCHAACLRDAATRPGRRHHPSTMCYARDCLVKATTNDMNHREHRLHVALMNGAIGFLEPEVPLPHYRLLLRVLGDFKSSGMSREEATKQLDLFDDVMHPMLTTPPETPPRPPPRPSHVLTPPRRRGHGRRERFVR